MHPEDENPWKPDFLHEALKWMLLKEIVYIDKRRRNNIALSDKLWHMPVRMPITLLPFQRLVTVLEYSNEESESDGGIEVESGDISLSSY